MTAAYRRLKELNIINKGVGNYVKIEKRQDGYYVGDTLITSIRQLHEGITIHFWYITNLSVISKEKNIMENYDFSISDWYNIQILLESTDLYKSISIMKVDDLDEYVSKSVLLGKLKIMYKTKFFVFFHSMDNKHRLLISDLNLIIPAKTQMFFSKLKVECIHINNLKLGTPLTGYVTNLAGFFKNCVYTKEIVLENFNTENVIDFSNMFAGCENLINLNIDCLKTNKVIYFNSMFFKCKKIELLDLSNFDISNARYFCCMFENCISLKQIKMNSWIFNEKQYYDFTKMYFNCNVLDNLDINKLRKTGKFSDIAYMFSNTKYENIIL